MALKDNKKPKKHLLYEMFNPRGNGKGISKEEAAKPKTVGRFFRYFSSNFNMMFALNIFMFLGNFPVLFGLFAMTGNLNIHTSAPASSLFGPIYGAITAGGVKSPVSAALMGVHGVQAQVTMMTTATKILFALTLLIVFTFGIVNACIAYVMRNIVKGDSTTLISDIKYCVKRNWKQAMLLGIIDLIMVAVIVYDVIFFFSGAGGVASFLFGAMLVVAMLYVMMRNYMYILLVTFDLSIWKILKNSFIFALLGFKRNIVAFLGGLAVWVLDYMVMTVVFPVGLVLPVIFLISFTTFMGIYAAYPKIKEIMIDPYYVSDDVGAKERTPDGDDEEEALPEPIFKDRG